VTATISASFRNSESFDVSRALLLSFCHSLVRGLILKLLSTAHYELFNMDSLKNED
jgi:hypothetical protein